MKLSDTISKYDSIISISIHSYADDVGSEESNLILTQKRALTIKAFIRSLAIISSNTKINAIGNGEINITTYSSTKLELRAKYRKSSITINYLKKDREEKTNTAERLNKPKLLLNNIEEKKKGDKIVLKNVLFAGGTNQFLISSIPELDQLVKILKENPTLKIKILGHVCCTQNGKDGIDTATGLENLSVSRAKRTYDFLIFKEIDKDRLSYEGLKGLYPLGGPKALDRRIEIEVVSN